MFCKKDVSKTSHESICAGVQRAGTDVSLLILGNFQEHQFCKTSVNEYLRETSQNMFTEKLW